MPPHSSAVTTPPNGWTGLGSGLLAGHVQSPVHGQRQGQELESRLPEAELPRTTDELIAEVLRRCLLLFDVPHARFVRPLDADAWLVHTRRADTMVTHVADHAEIAMAWMVGLGRQPLLVNRPRVAAGDGSGMRPISARRYLGIPIICQDRLVGVLEWSGDLSANIEGTLFASIAWLQEVAERMVFDPALEGREALTPYTVCVPGQRILHGRTVRISPGTFRLLSAIGAESTLTDLAARLDAPLDEIIDQVEELVACGLVDVLDPHDTTPLRPETVAGVTVSGNGSHEARV